MDLYRIVVTDPDSKKVQSVPYDTNPGLVSYRGSRILAFKNLFESLITNTVGIRLTDVL